MRDLKQGLGKKWFPNGDTYEASVTIFIAYILWRSLLYTRCIGDIDARTQTGFPHVVQLLHVWTLLVCQAVCIDRCSGISWC